MYDVVSVETLPDGVSAMVYFASHKGAEANLHHPWYYLNRTLLVRWAWPFKLDQILRRFLGYSRAITLENLTAPFLAPDDVQAVLPQTIAHRLVPAGDSGRGAVEQVRAMVEGVPLP